MAPVLCIPALAIFGIPQFAPVVASPLDEGLDRDREHRVGQSERHSDSLLTEMEDPTNDRDLIPDQNEPLIKPAGRMGDSVPINRSGRNAPVWNSEESKPQRSNSNGVRQSSWTDDPADEFQAEQGPKSIAGADRNEQPGFESSKPREFQGRPNGFQAPFDTPRPSAQANSQQRRDQMPATPTTMTERGSAPVKQYQREQPSGAASTIRQASHVQEALTWEAAVRRLNDLEIRNFRLERGHRENQFIFICSYTPSDSPRVSFRFEAEADEPLKAIEKVLDQISEWQQQRR
jgi:hypothetical protein